MKTRRGWAAAAAGLLLAFGCTARYAREEASVPAVAPAPSASTDGYTEETNRWIAENRRSITIRGWLGFSTGSTELVDSGCRVKAVTGENARTAGIQPGDLLVAVDGAPVSGICRTVFDDRAPGSQATLTMRRGGGEYRARITLQKTHDINDVYALEKILLQGDVVRLAVVIDRIKQYSANETEEGRASIRQQVLTQLEQELLGSFEGVASFTLLDRSALEKILAEYKLQLTGLISDETRLRIGKTLGATHLLQVGVEVYPGRNWSQTRRLLEVEGGRVLESVLLKYDSARAFK